MSHWFTLNFSDSASKLMLLFIEFHDFILMMMLAVLLLIFYILVCMITNKLYSMNIMHHNLLEMIWTLVPMMILIFMALPSLKVLYIMEEGFNPFMTVKCLGHQWYWSYEYDDFMSMDFDSFMLNYSVKTDGTGILFRLLDVDNRLVLPYNTMIRGVVSSVDVIHSWAMPSLGIKVDAIPGRMNQFILFLDRVGLFFGQCSEICGVNHSFMPIVLESIGISGFFKWIHLIN